MHVFVVCVCVCVCVWCASVCVCGVCVYDEMSVYVFVSDVGSYEVGRHK